MKMLTSILAITILSGGLGAAAQSQKTDVTIKAPDGVNLKATYFSSGRFGAALLLLHQCNMDRHAWDGIANDAANAGMHVLTLDFRGYGESGGQKLSGADAQRAQQEKWPGDVDAAWAYLLSQEGIDKTFVAAGGASCGVAQAADLAVRHHEIRALVLLSGAASDAAKSYLATAPVVAFGAASEDDTSAAAGIRDVVAPARKSAQSVLKIYPGTEHGVAMFAKHPELPPFIVNWLKSQLCCNNNIRWRLPQAM
jgi:dienelactone hydrolase